MDVFPSPIEETVFKIVEDTHLLHSTKQFLPMLRTHEIDENTTLPVITTIVTERRRSEDTEDMEADVLITIWDLFPGLHELQDLHDVHMAAIRQNANYQNDLLNIIDLLVDNNAGTGCYYSFVGQQRFIPSYKIDAFDKFLEGKEHPFRNRLFGSSVLFTLTGASGCITCNNPLNTVNDNHCENC